MNLYTLTAIVVTVAVSLAYINARFIRLPMAIAMMAGALVLSMVVLALGPDHTWTRLFIQTTRGIDFQHLLLNGLLGPLLFAGALTVDLTAMRKRRWDVGILASIGTIVSTVCVALATFGLFTMIGYPLPWLFCLLFGALISPTDPIAVLAMFKDLKAPRSMSSVLEGESLFNDGVGIVIFTSLYQLSFSNSHVSLGATTLLFLHQAIGGLLFGIALGWVVAKLIQPRLPIALMFLITLAGVMGGYAFAQYLGLSGPLAMVVAGMIVGYRLRQDETLANLRESLWINWEIIDELLNAILFLLVGFELLIIPFNWQVMWIGLLLIPTILAIRWFSVALPLHALRRRSRTQAIPYEIAILTWGGLRGGLAIALALSLPESSERGIILLLTYTVVAFAILVQGLSMKKLIAKSLARLL